MSRATTASILRSGAWAGMVLAEIGRRAPPAQVSTAIGGSLAYVNIGKFIEPIVFANIYLATQSSGVAFASMAVPAAVALYLLHLMKQRHI